MTQKKQQNVLLPVSHRPTDERFARSLARLLTHVETPILQVFPFPPKKRPIPTTRFAAAFPTRSPRTGSSDARDRWLLPRDASATPSAIERELHDYRDVLFREGNEEVVARDERVERVMGPLLLHRFIPCHDRGLLTLRNASAIPTQEMERRLGRQ